jgi:hypothetical protein
MPTAQRHPIGSLVVAFGSSSHFGEAYLGLVVDENVWKERVEPKTLIPEYEAFNRSSGVLGFALPLRVLGIATFVPPGYTTEISEGCDPAREKVMRYHYRQQDHTRLLWSPAQGLSLLEETYQLIGIISSMASSEPNYFSGVIADLGIYKQYQNGDKALKDKERTTSYARKLCACFEKEIPLPPVTD